MMSTLHMRRSGQGDPVVLLPPAPHSGAFFAAFQGELTGFESWAVDYPGYGHSTAVSGPSIEAYAAVIAPNVPRDAVLIGFHTGNLVAAEIVKRAEVAGVVMIDIPYFNAETRAAYAAKMERNARNAAFHAAFTYDPGLGLAGLDAPIRIIATQSSLLDLTRQAARDMSVPITERLDIHAPVFEQHKTTIAKEIRNAIADMRPL